MNKIIIILACIIVRTSFSAEAFDFESLNFVETAAKEVTHFLQKTAQALTGKALSSYEEPEQEEFFQEIGMTKIALLNYLEEATKNSSPLTIHNLIAEWEMLLAIATNKNFATAYHKKIKGFNEEFNQAFEESLLLAASLGAGKRGAFIPFSDTPWIYFLVKDYSTLRGLENGIEYLYKRLKKEIELWDLKTTNKKNERDWKVAIDSKTEKLMRIALISTQNQQTFFPLYLAQNLRVIKSALTTPETFKAALKGLSQMQQTVLQEIIHGKISLFIYGSYCDRLLHEKNRKSNFHETIQHFQKLLAKRNITQKTIETTIKNLKQQQDYFKQHDEKVASKEVQELLKDALEHDGIM